MPAGRKPKKLPESLPTEQTVEEMAGRGLTIEDICVITGLTEHHITKGQLSLAYKRGRAIAKGNVTAAQLRRALNDKHPGCVQAAKWYMGAVHHVGEHSTLAVARIGNADLEQLSDAELEAMIAANRSKGGE
jgi:hypothetical protein